MGRRAGATIVLSVVLVVLGLVLIVETALLGGGIGFVLGSLLVLAGALRSYTTLSTRPRSSRAHAVERRGGAR
ncbi:MAG: hypothetical protein M3292_09415 [Actinomycetota bacterium]|nr:hypothetical protein [Actinomycetota bacterium]